MQQGEPWIAEGDYLACHHASCEGPFLPLADFGDFAGLLLQEHAASPTLVVRNGVLCVPWSAIDDYSAYGSSPLDWELDPLLPSLAEWRLASPRIA